MTSKKDFKETSDEVSYQIECAVVQYLNHLMIEHNLNEYEMADLLDVHPYVMTGTCNHLDCKLIARAITLGLDLDGLKTIITFAMSDFDANAYITKFEQDMFRKATNEFLETFNVKTIDDIKKLQSLLQQLIDANNTETDN